MRIGDLNKPITIQQATVTPDAYGGGEKAWSTYSTGWAAIWPQKVKEVEVAGKLVTVASVLIRTRYKAGVTGAMRVVSQGRTYEIKGVRNVDSDLTEMELYCEEHV